jgi:hypothetical protein
MGDVISGCITGNEPAVTRKGYNQRDNWSRFEPSKESGVVEVAARPGLRLGRLPRFPHLDLIMARKGRDTDK